MIAVLQLGGRHGQERLRGAVEAAVAAGCYDAEAVRCLLSATELAHPPAATLSVGALDRFDRPLPTVDAYDALLAAAAR